MTDHRFAHRALDARIDSLVETVRTLAVLMERHARLGGFEQTARNIREIIADELTWPEDKEPSDAFGPSIHGFNPVNCPTFFDGCNCQPGEPA